MTDRPIRPLFPKGFRREIQVVLTTLSADREHPADVFGTTGASMVLGMSSIPFDGPVSSVRVARVDGSFKALPTYEEIAESDIDLIVAGTEDSIVMIEAGANEVPEAEVIEAIEYAQGTIAQLNALQREIFAELGKEKASFDPPTPDTEMKEKVREALVGREDEMLAAVQGEGWRGVDALGKEAYAAIGDDTLNARAVRNAVEDEIKVLVRRRILEEGLRPDDREIDQVRGCIPRGLLPARTRPRPLPPRRHADLSARRWLASAHAKRLERSREGVQALRCTTTTSRRFVG